MPKYDFKKIERKWQKEWAKNGYAVWHAEEKPRAKEMYILDMFPYPSGEGLHVGHVEGYTASDILSRFYRMRGFNVLHPMGWDAFGLPAENYAIKKKIHPAQVVKENVKNFKNQLNSLGFSYDWQREVNTTDPEYYKWTQWIFLQLFKKGLAYKTEVPVNWCPSDKTVLANEEVVEGHCERCDSVVERKNLKQWVLKITAYADRLLKDLDDLDWPEKVKEMQKNWIGRSEGAEIDFPVENSVLKIKVFTTRPDTVPGVSYLTLAPEHDLITKLEARIMNPVQVKEYIEKAKNKSERDRLAELRDKSGIELKGIKAVNPLTKKEVPVWISDYVLSGYGTGAIMAVPAHDQRDFEFAKNFDLPIVQVISLTGKEENLEKAYVGDGMMINAGEELNGLGNQRAKELVMEKLGALKKVNYKLRDWVFSRQRYWGEPIPLIFCGNCADKLKDKNEKGNIEFSEGELLNPGWMPVPESDLPVELPKVKNYEPTGEAESPLAGIEKWVSVKCPKCGGEARRETNTMPQWAGSCWYYLAYALNEKLKIKNEKQFWDKDVEKYWLPVDIYVGGVEHAVLHLLYARFWHKFLYDIEAVSVKEPFQKLVNQGLILGPDGQKMSKSRGNVVNPDELVEKFGADSLRLYEMFMGPLEDAKPWQMDGIVGMHRFLNRVYQLCSKLDVRRGKNGNTDASAVQPLTSNPQRLLHRTIKKVTEDIAGFKFNTAISALMILVNEMEKSSELSVVGCQSLVKLLFPFAPHVAQELWSRLEQETLLDSEEWPQYDEKLVVEGEFELLIQVNGKLRDKVLVVKNISQEEAEKLVLAREKVQEFIGKKKPVKTIFVPGRLINFVV